MNPWIDVLLGFREGKFPQYTYGLTPRLILGACQIPIGRKFENEALAYDAAKLMFDEMKAYNVNGIIVQATYCHIHNGAVFSLVDTKWNENSINVTFKDLWERYGVEIVEGSFNITTLDMKIIREIYLLNGYDV